MAGRFTYAGFITRTKVKDSTGLCGSITTEQFQTDSTSIIKTEIERTTQSRTLNSWMEKNIAACIATTRLTRTDFVPYARKAGRPRWRGITPKPRGSKVEKNAHYMHDHQPISLICENCGEVYETKNLSGSRFCSNACKSAYRRASGVDNETRTCQECGKKFEVNKYEKQTYCSRKCAWKARKKGREVRNG